LTIGERKWKERLVERHSTFSIRGLRFSEYWNHQPIRIVQLKEWLAILKVDSLPPVKILIHEDGRSSYHHFTIFCYTGP